MTRGGLRNRLPTRPWRRVLLLWVVLTGIVIAMALDHALVLTGGLVYTVLGSVALLAIGVVLAYYSAHPWLVAVGAVCLLWAAMSVALGCTGRMCPEPPGYERLQHIRFALEVGLGGPRLLISSDPEPCTFHCPYKLQFVPLAIGYLTYAHPLATED